MGRKVESEEDQVGVPIAPSNGRHGGPLEIGLAVVTLKLRDVNIADQRFQVNVVLFLDWKATKEEIRSGECKFYPHHNGLFSILNSESNIATIEWSVPKLVEDDEHGWLWQLRGVLDGQFVQHYELRNFPLDIQSLTLKIQIGAGYQGAEHFLFVPSRWQEHMVTHKTFLDALQDSTVRDAGMKFIRRPKHESSANVEYSQGWYTIKIQRSLYPYFFRVIFYLMTISLVALLAFRIPRDSEEVYVNRINHLTVVLLVITTFIFVVNSYIPKVPYLTALDVFGLANFAFVFFCLVIELLFSFFGELQQNDFLSGGYLALLVWVVLHLVLFANLAITVCKESCKLNIWGLDLERVGYGASRLLVTTFRKAKEE